MSDRDTEFSIEEGTLIIHKETGSLEVARVWQVDGEFIQLASGDENRWIRRDEIVAIGVDPYDDRIKVSLNGE